MDVTRNLEADDGDESPWPRCSTCGSQMTMVTVIGPTEAIVSPCGCHAPPDALELE